ncbi:hypothetical protein F5B21DRAFT_523334 [Xylaria acuta]|nr:hypothetical protein F5B21DRAFT_523334 [Xylaria acuta]
MGQTTGLSYSTISTTWASSTSYLVVDIYSFSPDISGALTPTRVTEEWWSFPNTAPTSSSPASTVPTGESSHAPSTLIPTEISVVQPTPPNLAPGPTSHAATKSPGLSNGIVAGVSIATALVGGLLGAILGLHFAKCGKRRKSRREYMVSSDKEKETEISSTATDGLQLDQFLLDSTPDTTIANELRTLGHLIQQHAETHYHLQPVQMDSSQLRQPLAHIGIERGSAPAIARLASLALEPRTRINAIRYLIAKAAFESTVIGGNACVSLLPPLVSDLSSIIPPIENHVVSQEATKIAFMRWRQLSAFLLHPDRSQRTPLAPSEDVSTQQAQELTVALNRFLEPFVSRDREERYEQENDLREVIVECAVFGYVLFSQPSEYRFLFESNEGPSTIVVCPGLNKVIDKKGFCYKPPLPRIAGPVVENI